jgi:DNA invertase Pin-like site-specific DNA recombinase
MGATEIKIFSDEGISGVKGREDRKGLNNLIVSATRKELDKVLVWSVDRLGRSLKSLVATLEDLQDTGVALYFHQQALDTSTSAGKAMFGMLAIFSSFEAEIIKERINAGLARAKSNGVVLGRRRIGTLVAKQILLLRGQGKTMKAISKIVGVSDASVCRIIQKAA